jgi:NAD(P)H-nitrite reductase large subunit
MSPRCHNDSAYICHCLHVTEEDLLEALTRCELRNLQDVKHTTGAGDGCTACHRRILSYLRQQRAVPA